MVWLLVHSSPRYYYTAILFFTFDSIPRRRKFARAHEENVGDRFVEGIERTSHRAVCILITLPDIFNIPRMDVVNWIHLFPFWRSDYERYWVFGYFSRLRFRSAPLSPPLVSLFSAISILRFVTASARYPDRYDFVDTKIVRDLERGYYPPTSVPTFQLFPLAKRFDYRWFAACRFSVLTVNVRSFRFDDLIFFFLNAYNYVRDYYKSFRYDRTDRNGFL